MNDKNKRLHALQEKYPALLGQFLGFKYKRGDMGVSRADNDWFECDEYYITADDLAAFLVGMEAELAEAKQDLQITRTCRDAEADSAKIYKARAEQAEAERDAAKQVLQVINDTIYGEGAPLGSVNYFTIRKLCCGVSAAESKPQAGEV